MDLSAQAPKRIKHDYTSEIQLKSLVIREKNKKFGLGTPDLNDEINALVDEYNKNKDPEIKQSIIAMSEKTSIDENSHNIFGNIVLLMIKKILTKPNFSGYSWQDDFYSDGCYRVFKYIHNFDHTKISEINGQEVSAFAYITQIIHNSIITIINSKNKESKNNELLIQEHNHAWGIDTESGNTSKYEIKKLRKVKEFEYDSPENLYNELKKINFQKDYIYDIFYKNYVISYDEYIQISSLFKGSEGIINIKKIKD